MKKCPNCHAKIYQEDDYCYQCGLKIVKDYHNKSIDVIPSFDHISISKEDKKTKYNFNNEKLNKQYQNNYNYSKKPMDKNIKRANIASIIIAVVFILLILIRIYVSRDYYFNNYYINLFLIS